MKIYHYSKQTNEFIASSDAREDPLEKGSFLIPANSTKIKPPPVPQGKVAVFGVGWTLEDDIRGTVYWTDKNTSGTIKEINEALPVGSTTNPPGNNDKLFNGIWLPYSDIEKAALLESKKEDQVDFSKINAFLKAFILSINDGSFVTGSSYTGAQMKAIIKAKL